MKAPAAKADSRRLGPEPAPADLDHGEVAPLEELQRRPLLQFSEGGLPALGEELRDAHARLLLDDGVDGGEGAPKPLGEHGPDGRLSGSHEAHERHVTVEGVQRSVCQEIRSRYAAWAAVKSVTASPPNFSRAARASSQPTAASATTASASTA